MIEEWKDIRGYETSYAISNIGRVRSKERMCKPYSSDSKRRHLVEGRIRRPSVKNGYFFLWLYRDGIRRMEYVHRLVADAFCEKNGKHVDHIDGHRQNNMFTNLRWTSVSGNLRNRREARGYHYHRQNKVYVARITVNKKLITLGYFKDPAEAHEVYLVARKKYWDV